MDLALPTFIGFPAFLNGGRGLIEDVACANSHVLHISSGTHEGVCPFGVESA